MTFLVLFVVVLFVFIVSRRSGRARAQMMTSGLEARGLILRASPTSLRTMMNGQPFEQRSVVLDVEVMGRAPYEISLVAAFPRLCEAFPGAALDLRVHPRNPNDITVVGPVGASGWMGATAGLFPWAPKKSASGCGTVVMIAVLGFLGLGAVISFVAQRGASTETPPETPAPAHTTPPPRVVPTVQAPAAESAACAEATRCCKTVGRTECTRYARMSETVCKTALQEEKRAAAKLHKTCE